MSSTSSKPASQAGSAHNIQSIFSSLAVEALISCAISYSILLVLVCCCDIVFPGREIASEFKEKMSLTQEITSQPKETASLTQEMTAKVKEMRHSSKEITSQDKEITSSAQEMATNVKEIIVSMQETLSPSCVTIPFHIAIAHRINFLNTSYQIVYSCTNAALMIE